MAPDARAGSTDSRRDAQTSAPGWLLALALNKNQRVRRGELQKQRQLARPHQRPHWLL